MEDVLDYDIEEILGPEGTTVASLIVRFSLPDVTSAKDLELVIEPDSQALEEDAGSAASRESPRAHGVALVIKGVDETGVLQPKCRVGLQFEVDEAGMHAKFRKKLRSLAVTVPVIRDLRPLVAPACPFRSLPSMAASLEDDADGCGVQGDGFDDLARCLHNGGCETSETGAMKPMHSLAMGLEEDTSVVPDAADPGEEAGAGGDGGRLRKDGLLEDQRAGPVLQEQSRAMALELKEQGNKLVKEGKHAQALVLYDQSIALFPADPAAYTNRALCRMKSSDFNAASADCQASLRLDAHFMRAHERLGAIHEARSDLPEAIRAYQAGLALDPDHKGCKIGLARSKKAAGASLPCTSPVPPAVSSAPAFSFTPSSHKRPASIQRAPPQPCAAAAHVVPPSSAAQSASSASILNPTPQPSILNPTPQPSPPLAPPRVPLPSDARPPSVAFTKPSTVQAECIDAALAPFNLEVRTLKGRGRGLFAPCGFSRGDRVLEAKPMACVVADKYAAAVCHVCFAALPSIKTLHVKCKAGCGGVVYCSRTCADADAAHRPDGGECKVLQAWEQNPTAKPASSRGLRLFIRLVYMYAADAQAAALAGILEHHPRADEDASMRAMAQTVNRFVLPHARLPLERLARLISQVSYPSTRTHARADAPADASGAAGASQQRQLSAHAQRNVHGVVDLEGHNLGHGLYPLASLFNHSCRPNAIVSFHSQTLVVRALRDIKADEEVTIAYVELYAPRDFRRQQLLAKKHFLCECERCLLSPSHEGESRLSAGPRALAAQAREMWDQALVAFHEERLGEADEALQCVLRMASGHLAEDHWVVFDVHKLLVDVCLARRDFAGLEAAARAALRAMATHLDAFHPSVALMCQHLATALMLQERERTGRRQGGGGTDRLREALKMYTKAWSVLCVSYGKQHRQTIEAKELADEARRQIKTAGGGGVI